MRWILMALFMFGCAESAVDNYGEQDGGDTDTEWSFDCERACDFEVGCMEDTTEQTWSDCVDQCESGIASATTSEQMAAVECLWFECVLEAEAGEVQCSNWVQCYNHCTE